MGQRAVAGLADRACAAAMAGLNVLYLTAKDMWNLFTIELQTNTWFSGKVLQS
jgi:hypothetical protein